jgi:hypothetical protein
MRLTTVQQAALTAKHGICANEACDTCRRPLDYLRITRQNEPGEWCSRVCRDGSEAAARYTATRKKPNVGRCWHCGLSLHGDKRTGTKYCDATCSRNARFAKVGGRAA